MSKRPHYFQVHKNKKARKLDKVNWKKIYKTITAATDLVKSLVGLSEAMKAMSKIKPNYMVGGQSHPEIIINKHGKEVELAGERLRNVMMNTEKKKATS